eukprot:5941287-Pleurochrysis_carterae.AAC.1
MCVLVPCVVSSFPYCQHGVRETAKARTRPRQAATWAKSAAFLYHCQYWWSWVGILRLLRVTALTAICGMALEWMRTFFLSIEAVNALSSLALAHILSKLLSGRPLYSLLISKTFILLSATQLCNCLVLQGRWRQVTMLHIDTLVLHKQTSCLLQACWLSLLAGALYAGFFLRRSRTMELSYVKLMFVMATIAVISYNMMAFPLHAVVRLWLLSTVNLFGCALDCRARTGCQLHVGTFTKGVCSAIAYAAPAYPAMVVAASTVLFLGTSLLTALDIPRDKFSWLLNWGSRRCHLYLRCSQSTHNHCIPLASSIFSSPGPREFLHMLLWSRLVHRRSPGYRQQGTPTGMYDRVRFTVITVTSSIVRSLPSPCIASQATSIM